MSDRYTISLPVFDHCLSGTGLKKVSADSDIDEKKALEQFARYFKNEMHYDNIQYEAHRHDKKTVGFLFTTNAMDICTEEHDSVPTRCVGGCSFRSVQDTWVLCWVWIHPFFRHKKLMSRNWKQFVNEFGNFAVETPVSPPMQSIMERQAGVHKLV